MTIESTDKLSIAPGTEEVSKGNIPATLANLAELCEKATGPDRALDQAIWLAAIADAPSLKAYNEGLKLSRQEAAFRLDYMSDGSRYTGSLDAAMTLVPEGQQFGCGSQDSTMRPWAWVGQGGPLNEPYSSMHPANAATPALALCAAALKAAAICPNDTGV